MKIGRTVSLIAALALVVAPLVLAADVSGKWKAEFDTQVGPQKYSFAFKVAGETLTGTASFERMGQTGQVELKEGKVKGDEISFVEPMDFQGTEVRIEYTGKVTGDEIKLTRKVGDFATEELVAKRVKD